RRHLAEAVDVVTVADFVERGDDFGMADEIPDALETERISLRERARDDDLRIFQREPHRVLVGKVHVGFVQDHDALLRVAEPFEFGARITASARRVRGGDERERRTKIPTTVAVQLFDRWHGEIPLERDRISTRAVDISEHRVERVAGREILNNVGRAIALRWPDGAA